MLIKGKNQLIEKKNIIKRFIIYSKTNQTEGQKF